MNLCLQVFSLLLDKDLLSVYCSSDFILLKKSYSYESIFL